jgi:leucyl-tRNA synthetase
MGVTYLVIAPECPLVAEITTPDHTTAVNAYVKGVASKSDLERTATGKDKGKTGVFTGAYATHPLTGEEVPIWIADYVLASYGTGCVMSVPAHDERDFDFAQKFGLKVCQVVKKGNDGDGGVGGETETELPFCEEGVVCNSGEAFDGLGVTDAKAAVVKALQGKGAGEEKVTYKLRDWVFSRQRYVFCYTIVLPFFSCL